VTVGDRLYEPDIEIWHVGADVRPLRITEVEPLATVKIDPRMGYNVFACRRASPWSSIFVAD